MTNTLTDQAYWEKYYHKSRVDKRVIESICGRLDPLYDQWIESCKNKPKTIIEIGAYPGRYIAYLSSKYNLEATALDFNSDTHRIKEAFEVMEVSNYDIIQADFLQHIPNRRYDLVYSNGFLEHFEDYDLIFDKHCEYLAPGGSMLMLIPNKRYLRKWYGWLMDRENLKAHNLKCMDLAVFRQFALRNQLQLNYLSYEGGFAYKVHQKLNIPQRIVYKIVRFIFSRLNAFLKKYPSKYYSGTIIAIFHKPV